MRDRAVLMKATSQARFAALGQWLLMSCHPDSQDSGGNLLLSESQALNPEHKCCLDHKLIQTTNHHEHPTSHLARAQNPSLCPGFRHLGKCAFKVPLCHLSHLKA